MQDSLIRREDARCVLDGFVPAGHDDLDDDHRDHDPRRDAVPFEPGEAREKACVVELAQRMHADLGALEGRCGRRSIHSWLKIVSQPPTTPCAISIQGRRAYASTAGYRDALSVCPAARCVRFHHRIAPPEIAASNTSELPATNTASP